MNEINKATAARPRADISALIESSSLGSPEARATRELVDADEADMVLRLAEERRRTGMVGRWVDSAADRPVGASRGEAHTRTRAAEPRSVSTVAVYESARETVVVTTVVTPKVRRWRLIGSAEGGAPRTVRAVRGRWGAVVRVPGGFGVPAVGRPTAARRPVLARIRVRGMNLREAHVYESHSESAYSAGIREGYSLVRGTLVRGTCDSMRRHWYVVLGAAAVCVLSRLGHRQDSRGDAVGP